MVSPGVYANRYNDFSSGGYANFEGYESGIPVFAGASGTVVQVNNGQVKIDFGNELAGFYDHLDPDRILVDPDNNKDVTPDTIIGYLEPTNKHLHLELRRGIEVINPLPYFDTEPRNIILEWDVPLYQQYKDGWPCNPLYQPITYYMTPTATSIPIFTPYPPLD